MSEEKALGVVSIEAVTLFVYTTQSNFFYFELYVDTIYEQSGWPQTDLICNWLQGHNIQAFATGEISSKSSMWKLTAKRLARQMNRYFYNNDMLIPPEVLNSFIDLL